MKGKLIKTDGTYVLTINKYQDEVFAISDFDKANNLDKQKLSLKNCEVIENGYDLDELAMGYDLYENINFVGQTRAYKAGFQKALEILGDKKFSEDDIKKALEFDKFENEFNNKFYESQESFIQSLQQTEWDVEVEMKKVIDETKIVGTIKGVKGSGNKITTYKSVPKLDENNCLILKRIK